MHQTTVILGQPELERVSSLERELGEMVSLGLSMNESRGLKELSPSLAAELERAQDDRGQGDVLEMLAACLRHTQRVTLCIRAGIHVVPITVFPRERLYHCPVDEAPLLDCDLSGWAVLRIEPALWDLDAQVDELRPAPQQVRPIGPLLWLIALRGPRDSLLPEIDGPAAYRVAPGFDIRPLPGGSVLGRLVEPMRSQPRDLLELSRELGLQQDSTCRWLNALYLQSGLIVSRTMGTSKFSRSFIKGRSAGMLD